jgi:hypothetical protein
MLTAQAHVIKSSMTLVGRQIGTFARKQAPTHFLFRMCMHSVHDAIQVEGHQRATSAIETRDCDSVHRLSNDSPPRGLSLLFCEP